MSIRILNNNIKMMNKLIKNKLNNLYNYDVDHKLPNLHRWCNHTSNRYKNSCNWEKKLENAVQDNCLGNYK